ncbi:Oidioi.mRNA.OKI2018_I69.XSR.g15563.t1.cds [Oikopleura dioica]|uniref:Oidioi.mRNA.OKI2018_I69.XSR.g15563.t1.cds n=1 Tax=Oikopleura dioica TaxID=34765 RepID=A0ABN7SD95_OIKDI|nr:Oidioi.mRNA.OKI2018_I69.XSR.g15563.t1.cds [Oikopleura dioica]
MPGYEPLSEDANEVLKNESPLENAEPSTADKLSIPIHTEDPTFADQLQLDEEPEIGIFEPNDRRYLLYFCLSFVGFKSCVAWKTTKTYFSQDINSPGLRFIVTGLAVLFSRFVVMCIHCPLKNDEEFCDPLSQMYPIGVNVTNGELSCILTTSNCQKTTCECDVKLVNGLVRNIDSFDQSRVLGYNYDQKRHCKRSSRDPNEESSDVEMPQNDMFRMELESLAFDDVNNEEQLQKNQARPNRKLSFNPSKGTHDICCGDFPNVKSFNSFGGRRACCANNVYDIRKNECCDGLIKQLGSC